MGKTVQIGGDICSTANLCKLPSTALQKNYNDIGLLGSQQDIRTYTLRIV